MHKIPVRPFFASTVLLLTVAVSAFSSTGLELVSHADQVVIGTARSLSKVGRQAVFQLEIERRLQGTLRPGEVVAVECDTGTYIAQWKEPSPPQRGIWFLRNGAVGRWTCDAVEARSGILSYPIAQQPLPQDLKYEKSAEVLDKVVLEAGAAVLETVKNNPRPTYLALLVRNSTEGYDSPAVRRLFRLYADSSRPWLKAIGLAELVKRGDVPTLLWLEKEMATLSDVPQAKRIIYMFDWIRDPNPETIAALGKLASSKSGIEGLNLAAARALRAMHTRETLPYLADLLDSKDLNMRTEGVLGLGFFASGVPIVRAEGMPGLDFLNKREATKYTTKETTEYFGFDPSRADEFVVFWKDWWLRHRAELSP